MSIMVTVLEVSLGDCLFADCGLSILQFHAMHVIEAEDKARRNSF